MGIEMARRNTSLLVAACIPLLALAVSPSAGCRAGASPPVAPGGTKRFSMQSADVTQLGGNATRWYWLNIPKTYEAAKPAMLVFVFHGFYDNGHYEMWEDSIPTYVNENDKNVVSVYPIGSYDGGQSASWNIEGGGLNRQPGPLGPICATPRRGSQMYTCYDSCSKSANGCNPHQGCDASSCMDDRGFIKRLLAGIEESVCVDLDAVHLTGISMGGQMVLQTALDLAPRIASVAPVAGARYWGYMRSPASPVAILDVHGHADHTIPANATKFQGPAGAAVSSDYFYYHPTPDHLNAFAGANGCSNDTNLAYPTAYDGTRDLTCNQPHGQCSKGSVVQCVGDWGHTWPLYKTHPLAYAELALGFFETHPRVRHD